MSRRRSSTRRRRSAKRRRHRPSPLLWAKPARALPALLPCRAGARSHPTRRRAPARGRGGSSPAARANPAGSGTGRGSGSARVRSGGGDACSPPLVPFEKAFGALLRAAQRLDPLVEERAAALGDGVAALRGTGRGLVPLRGEQAL